MDPSRRETAYPTQRQQKDTVLSRIKNILTNRDPAMPSPFVVGLRAPFSRPALLATALVLTLCVVLALAVNRLRQQATGVQTPPALNTTGTSATGPLKKGGEAIVTTTSMTPLRREPNEQAAVIMLVAEGQTATVVDGPRDVGGRAWWQITVGKETGWLPEAAPDGTKIIGGK